MRIATLRLLGAATVATLMAMTLSTPAFAAGTGLDGTITNQLTGAPVSGAGIVIQHQDGSGWDFTNSDATGHFAFPNAQTGQYVVHVFANDFVEQWLYGHANSWEADLITAPATLQIPLMPIQYGAIAGRVRSQEGEGVANVWVQLRRNGNWAGDTATDAKGRYRFDHIETGPGYTAVFTFPSGQVLWYAGVEWEGDATQFAITPNATTTVNMTRPPVGNLTIRALDAVTSAPIVGYCFYHQDGPVAWNTICTDAQGRAKLRDLTVGSYSGGGYDPNEVYLNAHFDPVAVTEDHTTTVTVRLDKSASLHVSFVDAISGAPVDGACIALADPVRSDIGGGGPCGPQIDMKGLFPQEHFRLFVAPYDHQHGAQWVSTTGGGTGDPALAKVFQPAPGEHLNVSVKLDGAGNVSGVVRDAVTGAGVQNVCPSPTAPGASYGPNMTADCTWDGQYFIRELGPYQWKLSFPTYDGQHAWVWSGGAANRASATAVQVVAGATTTVDVSLPATGTISGTVTVPAGSCLQCVTLIARDAATGDYASYYPYIRPDGTFTMSGFNTQDVTLFSGLSGGLTAYPTQLHTTVGGAVTGITIAVTS